MCTIYYLSGYTLLVATVTPIGTNILMKIHKFLNLIFNMCFKLKHHMIINHK